MILSESKNFRITYYEQGSDIVFITFGFLKQNLNNKAFGLDFCLKMGCNNSPAVRI